MRQARMRGTVSSTRRRRAHRVLTTETHAPGNGAMRVVRRRLAISARRTSSQVARRALVIGLWNVSCLLSRWLDQGKTGERGGQNETICTLRLQQPTKRPARATLGPLTPGEQSYLQVGQRFRIPRPTGAPRRA